MSGPYPSIPDQSGEVYALHGRVAQLEIENASLQAEIEELRRELNRLESGGPQ